MKRHFLISALLLGFALPSTAAPTQAENLFQRGQVYAAQKSYDKAVETYLQALASDPNHERAWISLAIVYGQQKSYDKAVKALEEVQKRYPKSWLSYKVLGLVRKDQQRPTEAITAFETYLQLIPAERLKAQDKADILKLIETLRKQAEQSAGQP